MADFDKIIIVTQKTALEELLERHNTIGQARFYVEHMGLSITEYVAAHDTYHRSLDLLKTLLPAGVRNQQIDREFLPNFLFGERDLVVAVGRDGLVVNTAKYLREQPLLGLNPDTERNEGVLLPYTVRQANKAFAQIFGDQSCLRRVTMAMAELNTGQTLYAVNDLFIGQRTHLSARYRIESGNRGEHHSSSGIIVSTGAGSTGWFRSVVTGAVRTFEGIKGKKAEAVADQHFDWEARHLRFNVREPFASKRSSANIVFGTVDDENPLRIISEMTQNGVIFSDGIESDCLEFNSGTIARIGIADKHLNLIVPNRHRH
jgi:NAD kinase